MDEWHKKYIDQIQKWQNEGCTTEECYGSFMNFTIMNFSDEFVSKLTEMTDNPYAMILLGRMYFDVEKNVEKGIKMYEKAVGMNNTYAMCDLANIYRKGKVVGQDFGKVIELYEKAAGLNCPTAVLLLATTYREGRIVEINYGKVIELYKKGIGLGDERCAIRLINMYQCGLGVPQDLYKALEIAIMVKKKDVCISLLKNITDGDGVDIDKLCKYLDDPYILSIDSDVPNYVRNMRIIINTCKREILKTVLLVDKKVPHDMVGEILKN